MNPPSTPFLNILHVFKHYRSHYGKINTCLNTLGDLILALPVYYDKDIDLGVIQSLQVGIIGYGAQGEAQALNLRDSKVKAVLACIKGV